MLDEVVRTTNILQAGKADLRNDGTKLSGGGRNTVARGAITSREDFSGNDEGRCIGPEILEEIRQAVQEDEGLLGTGGSVKLVVAEAWSRHPSVLSRNPS